MYLPNAQSFAKRLAELRRVHGDTGADAHAELVDIGRDIAELIPRPMSTSSACASAPVSPCTRRNSARRFAKLCA
ncbi:hypothetical protein EON81_09385, partial [bacterium]